MALLLVLCILILSKVVFAKAGKHYIFVVIASGAVLKRWESFYYKCKTHISRVSNNKWLPAKN
jgi:hypothetical protein